jgi:hypothetical protein
MPIDLAQSKNRRVKLAATRPVGRRRGRHQRLAPLATETSPSLRDSFACDSVRLSTTELDLRLQHSLLRLLIPRMPRSGSGLSDPRRIKAS